MQIFQLASGLSKYWVSLVTYPDTYFYGITNFMIYGTFNVLKIS